MHRKPPTWRQKVLLAIPILVILAVLLVLHIGSAPPEALDQLGGVTSHRHAAAVVTVPSAPDVVAARRQAETEQAQIARARYLHRLAVRRRHRRALRREQRSQAADLGTTASPAITYHGATSTQAERAVAFAYAQLGCPYVYGGTGPCQSGYDCSGLTMEAWAAAGVTIQRTSEAQWASLPAIPVSQIRPGDLLVFDGGGHIGIYVGNGFLIDSPQPGETVEKVAFSGWYQQNFAGAVRP